ncbi:hypothetical protein V2A60_009188 [Cordyceps javanica]
MARGLNVYIALPFRRILKAVKTQRNLWKDKLDRDFEAKPREIETAAAVAVGTNMLAVTTRRPRKRRRGRNRRRYDHGSS